MQVSSAPPTFLSCFCLCLSCRRLQERGRVVRLCCRANKGEGRRRATPWASLAPDHAFQAAQEARQEDHVSRRAPVEMWAMGSLLYCAVVALALHCVSCGCSAINLEGSALLKFQSRVEEDPHGAMAGWSARDADPCGWNGVRCADDRVVML